MGTTLQIYMVSLKRKPKPMYCQNDETEFECLDIIHEMTLTRQQLGEIPRSKPVRSSSFLALLPTNSRSLRDNLISIFDAFTGGPISALSRAMADLAASMPTFSDSTDPSLHAMDDRIVDLYLSTKLMDDPDGAKEKKTRLRQFVHHDKEIRNAKRISENSEQGVVFRIEIEGREYCLKVFKRWKFLSLLKIRERTQMLHSPFAYECRAFARLIDVGQNGTWAVKCHGWMRLSEDQFDALKPVVTRQQIATCDRWAIVKDYIHNPFHVDDIPEICKKLPIPKYALIAPMDFHPHNFRESFFVDLGSTRTYPCPPL